MTEPRKSTLQRICFAVWLGLKALLLLLCALITLGSGLCALQPLFDGAGGGLVFAVIGTASAVSFGLACFALARSIRRGWRDQAQMDATDPDQ